MPKAYLPKALPAATCSEYTKPITEEVFYKNTQLQDAVLRRLEIIGEAVKNIPQEFSEKYPIHEYFGALLTKIKENG